MTLTLDETATRELDTQAREQILSGHMMAIAGEANQIFRPVTMFDHGIDGEVEFKENDGRLHDAPRAGYFVPYTVAPGVDTIAVPGFDLDLLGHGYFAQAEALLHDIHDLMRHGEAPGQRQRITPDLHEGASFWKLRK